MGNLGKGSSSGRLLVEMMMMLTMMKSENLQYSYIVSTLH